MVDIPEEFRGTLLIVLLANSVFIVLFENLVIKMIAIFSQEKRKKTIREIIL